MPQFRRVESPYIKKSHPYIRRLSFATTYQLNGLAGSPQSPIVIIVMMVNRPQKVAEGHIRDACPVPPRYYVRGAEVNPLIDPDIDHIVSHIRKTLICFRLVDEGAHH